MMVQLFASLVLLFVYFMIPVFWVSDTSMLVRRIFGSAAVASFLSFPVMIPVWSWQSTITERRAARITQQLYAYQKHHGHYPESLEQLVPQQLAKVPPTAQGLLLPGHFQYKTYYYQADSTDALAGQQFLLSYYAGAMTEAIYSSERRTWHYDD